MNYDLDELRKKYNKDSLEVQIKEHDKLIKQMEEFFESLNSLPEKIFLKKYSNTTNKTYRE